MSMMRARVRGHRWVDHPAAAVMKARVPGQWVDCPAAVVMEAREQGRCWIDHPAVAVMEARVQGRHWVDRPSVGLSTAVCGWKKSKVLSDSLSEAVGLESTTCVKQRGKPESIAVHAATEGNAPSPSVRGLSDFFYLPLDPSDNSEPNSKEQKLLVGPFQVLGDAATNTQGPVGDDTKRFSLLQSRRRMSASSSRGRNVLTGEAPRADHDYTNLVYDKNAPSSRALKTLVKPISMTRHINARVERVEEGEGSSLVTISGLNRKAAGGSYPYTLRPVLGTNKEGMPIVETLEDALADTIQCREKLHDINTKAIQAKPCPPILVDACNIPVLKEVVITPARSHQDLHCTFKPRTWTPRTKRKPPPPLQHQDPKTDDTGAISLMQSRPSSIQHQLTDPKTDGANAQNAISLLQRRPPTLHYQLTDPKPHDANAQKAISLVQRKGPTLQYQVTDPKIDEAHVQNAVLQLTQRETENGAGTVTNAIVYTNEGKVEDVDGTRLPQECLSGGLVSARLKTGEQTQVVSSVHSELDQDAFIHINNQTIMGETSRKCNQEITVNHTVMSNENKPAEQHIVIDNEIEATTTQHLSTNVCHYCLKIFHSPTMLCKHVITVHAAYAIHPQYTHYLRTLKRDSQVVCPLCPHLSVLCNEYHLRTHLVSCHGRTKADLVDSTAAAGLPSSVVCEVCQVHFLTVKELQAHARLMHNCDVISCPHCPLVFVRGDTRARHMAAVHGDNSGCPFVCRLCDAAFESKDDLRLHKQVHRRGSSLQDGGRNCIATTPRPRAHRSLWRTKSPRLHCQYCPDSEFTDVAHLVSHRQQVHPGPVPVHCLVCGTGFHRLRAMSSHLHTHLSADPTQDSASNLQCPLCPEKASLSAAPSQMLSHVLNKHQDRFPHSCTLCALRFVSEVPLHVHLKQAHQQDSAGSLSVSDGLTEGVSEVPLHVHLKQAHQQDSAGFAGSVSVSDGLTEGVSEVPLHVHFKQAHQQDSAGSVSVSDGLTEGVSEVPLHVHFKQAHQQDSAGFAGSWPVSDGLTEGVSEVPLHVYLKQAHQQDSAGSWPVSDGLTEGVSEVPLYVHLKQAHQQDSAGFAGSLSVSNGLTEGVSETVDLQQAHQHDIAGFSGSLSASKATTEGVLEMPLHVHLKQAHQNDVADFSGSLSASKAATEGVLEMPQDVQLKQAHQHDIAGFSGSLSASDAAVECVPETVHLKQSHQYNVTGFSGSLSASKTATEGKSVSNIIPEEGKSVSDIIQEQCPDPCSLVASASESIAGKIDAGSVLCCLPPEVQTQIQRIIQQGKQAVVTVSLQNGREQKIVFTPAHSHTAEEITQPASHPISLLEVANKTLISEHSVSVGESNNDEAVTEDLPVTEDLLEHPTPVREGNRNEVATEELSQHTVAGLYYMSSTPGDEATTTMEEMASVDSHLVMCDMSAAAGLADEHYEHEQNAHPICAQSVTMVNSGGVFLTSSQPEKAVVSVDGLGEFSSEYGSKEEEGMGETQRLAVEESMLEQAMQVEMERTSDVVNEETVMVIITETGDQFVVR
ncbi:hypothetical protein ACOMHN_014644 [Nucella lapillus]